MENEQLRPSFCNGKSALKFCLVYFTTLLVLLIIFTAFNNEPMDESQTVWWWLFLISLLLSGAMSFTALFLLLYTDYIRPSENIIEQDIEQNLGRSKSPVMASENSASFKTILTINSQPPGEQSAKFLNLTPEPPQPAPPPKSSVTVVDVPAMKKKDIKKKREDISIAKTTRKERKQEPDVPGISVIPTVDEKKKKKTKNKPPPKRKR